MEPALNTFSNKNVVLRSISKSKKEFSISRSDRIIISAHAIFEGIGIAGLISAAFWYTTAPMAPDGFKGPISTLTITITTIISLFLAIPIARLAFRKLITDMEHLFTDLTSEVREYIYSYDELIYELLKIRCLCSNDSEFEKHLSAEMMSDDTMITKSLVQSVCLKFNQFKSARFQIRWKSPIKLIISANNNENSDSITFLDILKDKDLSTNKSIRKSLILFIKKQFLDNEINFETVVNDINNDNPKTGHFKNVMYGTASGVACTEVLLSIGWTVISILIGVKAIVPISNMHWAIFAICCIFSGGLFGLGMGLSRHKQKFFQSLNLRLKDKNNVLLQVKDHLNNICTEKSYLQKNTQ